MSSPKEDVKMDSPPKSPAKDQDASGSKSPSKSPEKSPAKSPSKDAEMADVPGSPVSEPSDKNLSPVSEPSQPGSPAFDYRAGNSLAPPAMENGLSRTPSKEPTKNN